jgi:hypothetical protein
MPRQNYPHSKRQREIAKKQKRDEKLQRKQERKTNPDGTTQEVQETQEAPLAPPPEANS